jgi:hypothetical protein
VELSAVGGNYVVLDLLLTVLVFSVIRDLIDDAEEICLECETRSV